MIDLLRPDNLVNFGVTILILFVFGFIAFIVLTFIRSILGRKLSLGDIIIVVLLVVLTPDIARSLWVNLSAAVNQAIVESIPHMDNSRNHILNYTNELNIGVDTDVPVVINSTSLPTNTPQPPTPLPTQEVIIITPLVVEATPTLKPTATPEPTLDPLTWNPQTPAPTRKPGG